jgi:hypothetical protein
VQIGEPLTSSTVDGGGARAGREEIDALGRRYMEELAELLA